MRIERRELKTQSALKASSRQKTDENGIQGVKKSHQIVGCGWVENCRTPEAEILLLQFFYHYHHQDRRAKKISAISPSGKSLPFTHTVGWKRVHQSCDCRKGRALESAFSRLVLSSVHFFSSPPKKGELPVQTKQKTDQLKRVLGGFFVWL